MFILVVIILAHVCCMHVAAGTRHGWAESSLVMAENVVKTGWDVGKPDWLTTAAYNRIIF